MPIHLSSFPADGISDPAIARLVQTRSEQLAEYGDNFVRFVVAQAGDTITDIEAALGMSIHSFEWVLDHCDLYELPFVEGQDGSGAILIVPPRSNPELLSLCRAHAIEADHTDGG
jgi:hypothetical protein